MRRSRLPESRFASFPKLRGIAFETIHCFLFGRGLAAVSTLSTIAVRHPDGLYGLAVPQAHQVALGAVHGTRRLDNPGESDSVSCLDQLVPQPNRQDGDLVDPCNSLTINGFYNLIGAIPLLAEALHQGFHLVRKHAEERVCGSLLARIYRLYFVQHRMHNFT